MKYYKLISFLFFIALWMHTSFLYSQSLEEMKRAIDNKDVETGVIIVKLKNNKNKRIKASENLNLFGFKAKQVYQNLDTQKGGSSGARTSYDYDLDRFYRLEIPSTSDMLEEIKKIKESDEVEVVQPSYVYYTNEVATSLDPRTLQQGYLQQILAPESWKISFGGSRDLVIAIVDNGVDYRHQDLRANLYVNYNEVPNNGIDDDNDGYPDNYYGWDFVGSDASNIRQDSDPIPGSANDHGTHVAGIATGAFNQIGIMGVAYNCKFMALKCAEDVPTNRILNTNLAIKYAVDHGAKVINCSFGSDTYDDQQASVIRYAVWKGAVVVAAAGNSGVNEPNYPASYPEVISVANVNSNDVLASSSTYHSTVDISAPGTSIYSTSNSNSYVYKTGTSMAAPMVSAVAGLILSLNPKMTVREVKDKLLLSSDNIDQSNIGKKGLIGAGRLNAFKALQSNEQYSISSTAMFSTKSGGENIIAGDEFKIKFTFKNNESDLKRNVRVNVSNTDFFSYVTPVSGTSFIIPPLKSGQSYTTTQDVIFKLKESVPENKDLVFRVEYSFNDGSSSSDIPSETYSHTFNLPYLDIKENNIETTLAKNANIGIYRRIVSGRILKYGKGFRYKNMNFLKEMGLVIGTSSSKLLNGVKNSRGGIDQDFYPTTSIVNKLKISKSDQDYETSISDEYVSDGSKLNLDIKSKILTWKSSPYDNFVIVEYEIKNINSYDVNNLHVGIFSDWDVYAQHLGLNKTGGTNNIGGWFPKEEVSYVAHQNYSLLPLVGIKPLTDLGSSLHCESVNMNTFSFSKANKYNAISGGFQKSYFGGQGKGYDIGQFVSIGPVDLSAFDKIKVAFALVVGDTPQDLKLNANAAKWKYFNQTSDVRLVNSDTVCSGATKTLNSFDNRELIWYDSLEGGNQIAEGSSFTFQADQEDTVFYVKDKLAPNALRQQVEVAVIPSKKISLIYGKTPMCKGDEAYISADADATSYLWNTGEKTRTILVTNAGKYSVNISNSKYGCTVQSDTMEIKVIDVGQVGDILSNSPVCFGGTLSLSVNSVPNVEYTWTGPGSFSALGPNVNVSNFDHYKIGTYKLSADFGVCVIEKEKSVGILEKWPSIKLTPKRELTAEIEDNTGSWQWYIDDKPILGANKDNYMPLKNGVYHVISTDGNCIRKSKPFYYDYILSVPDEIKGNVKVYPTHHNGTFKLETSGLNKFHKVIVYSLLSKPIPFEIKNLSNHLYEIKLKEEFVGMILIKVIFGNQTMILKTFSY